ncbi:MAG: uL15 family ribosomal protein [Candidatus Aenigmarchaeota archaeon]|nr:uL15 family ribosomal protein [Candidatus Aenigmarchaeota archaeon]
MRGKREGMRGRRTHGHGSHKKWRGAGSRGGHGFAGSFKHKRLWVLRHHPEHLEKKKFKSLREKQVTPRTRVITLRDLDALIRKKGLTVVDLTGLGYDKILATGSFTAKVKITHAKMSPRARERIEAAGSTVVEDDASSE